MLPSLLTRDIQDGLKQFLTTLALWGGKRRQGAGLPIEFLVHGLTRRNAEQVGWLDRGLLADLNIIDFVALECRAPHIVHDMPAGGRRPCRRPSVIGIPSNAAW